jgi:hypothetical protein
MNPVTDKRKLKWDDMGNCNWCILKECGKECVSLAFLKNEKYIISLVPWKRDMLYAQEDDIWMKKKRNKYLLIYLCQTNLSFKKIGNY